MYSFIGTPCYDILIYLSILLKNLNKKVLVIDDSVDQEVMNCIEKPLDLEGMIHYNQVDYLGGGMYSSELLKEYDIVLQLLSYSEIPEPKEEVQEAIIVTDTKRKNMEGAKNVIMGSGCSKQLIIRDILDKKLGRDYFAKAYLGKENGDSGVSKKDIYEVGFDEMDYCYRIRLEHEVFRRFYSLSADLKEILFQLASELGQMPMKRVKEAYRTSKRRR